jgi:hypothetical protein
MDDAGPVDNKDKPGEYRERVRQDVFRRVGAIGAPITSAQQVVGDWAVHSIGVRGERRVAGFSLRLEPNGHAVIAHPQRSPSPHDEWRVNQDGSFSLIEWCPPMPQYGITEPQLEEIRRHAAVLPDGSVVIWNGDASVVEQWTGRHNSPTSV